MFTRSGAEPGASRGRSSPAAPKRPKKACSAPTSTLSADGNTALIGAWNDDNDFGGHRDYSGKGAAWVFTRSGAGVWSQQGPKLTGAGEVGDEPGNENGKFGTIVALSADGNTALIGAWNDDDSKGAAWVFTRSGAGVWSQQGPKLTPTDEVGEGRFGVSVALSADGDTALIGALYDNGARGASWVYRRSGTTWTQEGGKLTGGGESGRANSGPTSRSPPTAPPR